MLRFPNIHSLLLTAAVLVIALPVHEYAHAFAADRLGDNTPRWQGRLSLNPLVHLDLWGSILLLVAGFGWAKPVQVNAANFAKPRRDMMITAMAGPLANIIMATIGLVAIKFAYNFNILFNPFFNMIIEFLYFFVSINLGLAVFNLLPIPPLDGSRIVAYLLPRQYYSKVFQYERIIFVVLIVTLYTGILSWPLGLIRGLLWDAINWLVNTVFFFI